LWRLRISKFDINPRRGGIVAVGGQNPVKDYGVGSGISVAVQLLGFKNRNSLFEFRLCFRLFFPTAVRDPLPSPSYEIGRNDVRNSASQTLPAHYIKISRCGFWVRSESRWKHHVSFYNRVTLIGVSNRQRLWLLESPHTRNERTRDRWRKHY
jgi:hypothetical protein